MVILFCLSVAYFASSFGVCRQKDSVPIVSRSCGLSYFLKLTSMCLFGYFWADRLKLRSAEEYRYLNQSSCLSIDNVDDARQFCFLRVRAIPTGPRKLGITPGICSFGE